MSGQNKPSSRNEPVSLRSRRVSGRGRKPGNATRSTTTGRKSNGPRSAPEAVVVQLPRRPAAATKSRSSRPPGVTKRHNAAGTSGTSAHRRRPVDATTPSRLGEANATTAKPTARKRSRAESSRAPAPARAASLSPPGAGGGLVSQSMDAVGAWLKAQIHRLLEAMRDGEGVLTKKIQEWMDTLADAVADGGPGMNAGLAGIQAALAGKNPMWAAVKGLVSGLSGKAKAALVLLVIFGLL